MTANEIYQEMYAGNIVRLRLPSEEAFATLRTLLHRQHRQYTLLDLTNEAIRANYLDGFASFRLVPKRVQRQYSVTLEQPDEKV